MTRDLDERLAMFCEDDARGIQVERIALNMDQIRAQRPPRNPAKESDSRFSGYRAKFGESSWELDALKPTYLATLIRQHVDVYVDKENWDAKRKKIDGVKAKLLKLAKSEFKE